MIVTNPTDYSWSQARSHATTIRLQIITTLCHVL